MKRVVCFVITLLAVAHAANLREVRHLVSPSYPHLCRVANIQGTVIVTIQIGAEGSITSAHADGGHRLLQEAALENAKKWKFTSAAASSEQTIVYSFVLTGKQTYYDLSPTATFDLPGHVEINTNPYQPQP